MPQRATKRLVVFGDGRIPVSRMLVLAACDAARVVPGVEVVAVCEVATASAPAPSLERRLAIGARRRLARWPSQPAPRGTPPPVPPMQRIAEVQDVPLLVPPRLQVNHPAFREELRALGVDLGLSLYCGQVFRPPLLALFEGGVANFHNGLLPEYRGLGATAWSIYNGEERTGFTFHWMSPGIDEGAVLLRDSVAVTPERSAPSLEVAKTRAAIPHLREVLRCMVAGEPGVPQGDGGRYFSAQDHAVMREVDDPAARTSDELLRRLRAFGSLTITLDRPYSVTELARVAPGGRRPRLAFIAADGVLLAPTRIDGLLAPAFRAYRAAADLYRRARPR
ncbi:MAG: hypothetical protein GEU80_06900 [Dehalococcoidia bacterium]|nr:hypothetical protein [Dehalococcoidia bacterium]